MPEACRITDPSHCPADAHGCPKCPHDVTGPATSGSVNVLINGIYALRKQDRGSHAACCAENSWEVQDGAPGVFINGRNAARVGDPVEHCGGNGQLCCAFGVCPMGRLCLRAPAEPAALCRDCGGNGQPCCAGGACDGPRRCQLRAGETATTCR